jgi:predicted amidophosphoribosyltransferase
MAALRSSGYRCLECGGVVADGLARFGSMLCHDCRDELGVHAMVIRELAKRPPRWQRFWHRGPR